MKEAVTKMMPALGWVSIGLIFILIAGVMIGKAGADWENQKLQMQLECIKAGGSPTTTAEKGGFICTKK